MNKRIQDLQEKLSSDFFGFWVKRRRVTIMLMVLLIGGGLFALASIPKESSPNIEFGIIGINTVYIGASPEDVDQLVTEKIEKAINDIEGIDKIESTSRLSVSSINVTLENEANTNQVLTDIKDEIEKTNLPTEAEDPVVTEISTDTEQMFDVLLYANAEDVTISYLKQKAESVKSSLEGKYKIAKIDIDGSSDYEIRVLLDKAKVENIGLGLQSVAQTVRGFVTRLPLGNYTIDETSYDYRFTKSIESEEELENTIIPTNNGAIRLSDIATIERKYDDERILKMGSYQDAGYAYVRISFDKNKGANIFSSSASAKAAFEDLMKKNEFSGLQYSFVQDIAEVIQEDYQSLAKNGLTTLILVFIAVFIFVGRKESLIATVSIPLAFFVTFIVLNQMDLSLNFLTNFSLIVTFGIAIDTIIVIIEGAAEKMKLGHDPFSSVLLAVRDYKRPLIAGTTTTVIVFIPLFALPGVTGKFLAYIPITIFITLIAALFISLTINPVLYYLTSKKREYYIKDEEEEEYMDEDEKEILDLEREGKKELNPSQSTLRHRTIDRLGEKYEIFLKKFLKNKKSRLMVIILPIVILILSFPILTPAIGFEFFPSGDNPNMFVDITAPVGSDESVLEPYQSIVDNTLSSIPEIENYYYTIDNNELNISIELFSKEEREKAGQRDSFGVEEEILEELSVLREVGLTVESAVQSGGPPSGKAVGVKLIAESIEEFETLKQVSTEFEEFLRDQEGTKNVSNTSEDTPGQFIFDFNKDALDVLGLTPGQMLTEIRASINGITAGSLPGKFDDHDIKVLYQEFTEQLTPQDVENIVISTSAGAIRVGDVANYTFANNINAINREDGNIVIRVESDIEEGITPTATQSKLGEFARSYQYPSGISFEMAGENNENSDIIVATGVAFIIALLAIYSILVLQFNSFKQPMFIMYTVLMALLGTNIGLYLTGNPYSMAFGIGFIALTGIVVNDAIVFIDRINRNRTRGMDKYTAITEAGKTRLQPIILTTITTILGLMSIVREDEFFAGLAYTIMFGLFVGSLMTLFVIPAIYQTFIKNPIYKMIKKSFVIFKNNLISHSSMRIPMIISLRIIGIISLLIKNEVSPKKLFDYALYVIFGIGTLGTIIVHFANLYLLIEDGSSVWKIKFNSKFLTIKYYVENNLTKIIKSIVFRALSKLTIIIMLGLVLVVVYGVFKISNILSENIQITTITLLIKIFLISIVVLLLYKIAPLLAKINSIPYIYILKNENKKISQVIKTAFCMNDTGVQTILESKFLFAVYNTLLSIITLGLAILVLVPTNSILMLTTIKELQKNCNWNTKNKK